ncbi:MAG: hypothetical protein FJZ16_05285 [Candidatus Omnitrophica bacterium]|nr:hypothetical protein [Candidatus Omnitrophota bacterium]
MRRIKAFTLVELLITSLIFVVVILTIYSAFRTGIFGYRNIEGTINVYQTARLILERINLDLRNSFNYSEDETKFMGDENNLSFLSLVDTFSEDKIIQEYAFISYNLKGDKLMRLCRKNQEALNDKSRIEPEEMASNIEGITLRYGHIGTSQQQIEWKDIWNDTKASPIAIKVKLTLRDKTRREFERMIFLPLVQ